MSVVFDFNASLNDVAPVSPILLSVNGKRNGKSVLYLDVFFCLHLSSPFRLSSMSVVFDFNDLPNDVALVASIMFPDDVKRKKSSLLMDVFCVSSFFCLHISD